MQKQCHEPTAQSNKYNIPHCASVEERVESMVVPYVKVCRGIMDGEQYKVSEAFCGLMRLLGIQSCRLRLEEVEVTADVSDGN